MNKEPTPAPPSRAGRSLAKSLWYRGLKVLAALTAIIFFRLRCYGRHNAPKEGGVIVLSNHQSNMDPVLVGLAVPRRLNYLARDSLFGFAPFRWLIESLDAIPIDREGLGLAGIKECLRRLKRGEMVLLFPEGTRTRDGELGPLKPGFSALARRGDVWLLPVGVDGAFDAWPRTQTFPRPRRIVVCVGPPLHNSEIADLTDDELVALIHERMRACHNAARAALSGGPR